MINYATAADAIRALDFDAADLILAEEIAASKSRLRSILQLRISTALLRNRYDDARTLAADAEGYNPGILKETDAKIDAQKLKYAAIVREVKP